MLGRTGIGGHLASATIASGEPKSKLVLRPFCGRIRFLSEGPWLAPAFTLDTFTEGPLLFRLPEIGKMGVWA